MSHIAGIVSLSGRPLGAQLIDALLGAIPEGPSMPWVFEGGRAVLVHSSLEVFPFPERASSPRGAAVLAGRPIWRGGGSSGHWDSLGGAEVLDGTDGEALVRLAGESSGAWAAAVLHSNPFELRLVADRLAVRPLFWWVHDDMLGFASTLATAERLSILNLTIEPRGLFEHVCLGYALSDRTPFAGVRRLLPGEILTVDAAGITRSSYWSWANLPVRQASQSLELEVLSSLRQAILARGGGSRRGGETAFLSGGLDSRVVAVLLHELGAALTTFNFSPRRSLDAVLAREMAIRLGSRHQEAELPTEGPIRWASLLAQARVQAGESPVQLSPAWSGDGGSVCAGQVYLTPSIVALFRGGREDDAIREHILTQAAPFAPRDLAPAIRAGGDGALLRGIAEELAKYPEGMDPARKFFLFLVENDQRRHLDGHFEGILEHRQELETPFLDGPVLEATLAIPVDEGIGHRFYDKWFGLLPDVARSVPWQTYPGHVPCPLPVPSGLRYQWDAQEAARNHPRRFRVGWLRDIAGPGFPDRLLRRDTFALRAMAHLAHVSDQSGPLDRMSEVARWARKATS